MCTVTELMTLEAKVEARAAHFLQWGPDHPVFLPGDPFTRARRAAIACAAMSDMKENQKMLRDLTVCRCYVWKPDVTRGSFKQVLKDVYGRDLAVQEYAHHCMAFQKVVAPPPFTSGNARRQLRNPRPARKNRRQVEASTASDAGVVDAGTASDAGVTVSPGTAAAVAIVANELHSVLENLKF